MATNNHTNAIISQVNIGNALYDIHDANAIHTLADLGSLGLDTSGVFVYKGTVATVADLPTTGNKVGHVYHVTANHSEYIWAKVDGGTSESWEEFGEHFVVGHTHSIPALSGSAAAQKWTQDTTNSSVQITGSNEASAVTGTISVPKPSGTTKYMKATSTQPTLTPQTDSVLGTGTTFSASGVTVGGTGTAKAITGFGTHTTAKAITALEQTTPTAVTIPNVTGVGTASTWNFNVTTGGVLEITGANSTTPTLGTAITASKLGSEGTTKVYSSIKTTADTITALGTATTSDCLTGVTVTAQPSITVGTNDQVAAVIGGTISTPTITLSSENSSATGRAAYISAVGTDGTNSVTISNGLTAAAQKWSQGTGTVVVKGTNEKSSVTTTANTTGQPA